MKLSEAKYILEDAGYCAAEWSHFGNKGTKLTGEEEVRVLDELNVTVLDVYTGSGKKKTHLDRRDTYYRDEH